MADSEVKKRTGLDDDTFMAGILLWLLGSGLIMEELRHHLGAWEFVLVWLVCAYLYLAGALVHAVFVMKPTRKRRLSNNLLWKALVVGEIVVSLLGPLALLAGSMWVTAFLFRVAKQRVARVATQA